MMRILDIASKDLLQLIRDRMIFLFLLIMPVVFTFLFGYAFGGFDRSSDPRLPLGFLDQDQSRISKALHDLLSKSDVVRLVDFSPGDEALMRAQVSDEKLAAGLILPIGYAKSIVREKAPRLELIADTGLPAGTSAESEVLSALLRLDSAIRAALILEQTAGEQIPFTFAFQQVLDGWQDPPIRVIETTSTVVPQGGSSSEQLAHTAPGMMLQFAIAGLLTSAQVMVEERRSRALQRLLTTAIPRQFILLGHFLAIFSLLLVQFLVLIAFGQFMLGVNYLHSPSATLLVAFTSALCIASLGMLIGVYSRTSEQAVIFSLVPMFILAGLGGAWVPLDVAGRTFEIVGHFTPLAWAMDGFKNVSIRGLGFSSAFLPSLALLGYAVLFLSIAAWRFKKLQET